MNDIARTPASELSFDQLMVADKSTVASSIEQRAYDKVADLINCDSVSSLTARTNAFGWGLDTFEVDPDSIEVSANEISCTGNVQFTGEQDEDRPPCGDIISGHVTISINRSFHIELSDEEFDLDEY